MCEVVGLDVASPPESLSGRHAESRSGEVAFGLVERWYVVVAKPPKTKNMRTLSVGQA